MRTIIYSALAAFITSTAVFAEDLAVIFANSNYSDYPNATGIARVENLRSNFESQGFSVMLVQNTRKTVTHAQSIQVLQRMQNAEQLALVVAGHVVSTRGQNWLLHTDAGLVNSITIGQNAMPLQPFLKFASDRPGDATVVVADASDDLRLGFGVLNAAKLRGIPQGTTLIEGKPGPVAKFMREAFLRPGQSIAVSAEAAPNNVQVSGYVPKRHAFVDAKPAPSPAVVERQFWEQVRSQNTAGAYDRYLRRYPNGRFVAEAVRRKAEVSLTPQDRARIAEEQLNLNRGQRRAVQRQLTLLGFDTSGVDGVFGPNTRRAIARWQNSVGNAGTGYLSANQINRIEASAAIRAEELRREAEQRRLEAERKDRDYWQQTGLGQSEEGMLAYLQRYPDGLFSATARQKLKALERERRRQAQLAERQAWDKAVMIGSIASYQDYLGTYPRGLFANDAKSRIQALRNPETSEEVVDSAQQEESKLGLNQITRRLIEAQLRSNNLNPGAVDGRFTGETRRALRQYQRATNEPVTGYVTRNTIVNLLASAVE